MSLYLHHVSMLTPDVEGTIAFYQEMLGMRLSARFHQAGQYDIALLQDESTSSRFAIELIGPPYPTWMNDLQAKHGPIRDHYAFVVDDVEGWHEKLKAQKVEIVQPPVQFLTEREMYFRDPSGTIVELMEFLDPASTPQELEIINPNNGIQYHLHHMSVISRDLLVLGDFYTQVLGLSIFFDMRDEGIIFYADSAMQLSAYKGLPSLAVIAPPGLWDREKDFLERYGPGIDHVSFVVPDVDEAYEELISRGAQFHVEPVDFGELRLAYFKDPNGLDIEIESVWK